MTCTVLIMVTGIVDIIYGITLVKEASKYDRTNGSMIIIWGILMTGYGGAMYQVIKKYDSERWIEQFQIICILILMLQLIFGSAGIKVGSRKFNKNIVHYLTILYTLNDEHSNEVIADVHQTYKCCGLFNNRTFIKQKNGSITWSCCEHRDKEMTNCTVENSFQIGCEGPVSSAHNDSFYSLGSMWMCLGVIYFLVVILAFYFKKVYTHRPNN